MRQQVRQLALIFALVGAFFCIGPAHATVLTWASAVNGDWSDPTRWNPQQVPGPGDIALIVISGTYSVTIDEDVDVSRFSFGATLGTQTLVADGRNINLSAGISMLMGNGSVQFTSCALTGGGTLRNQAEADLDAVTLNTLRFSNAGGDLDVMGVCEMDSSFTTDAASIVRIKDGASLTLTTALGMTNYGQLLFEESGGTLAVTNGALTNDVTGVITTSGAGLARTLSAELVNDGTITLDADLNLVRDSANHSNGGLINLIGGDLSITQSGVSPSIINSGSIQVSSSLTVTGGTLTNDLTGTIEGDGVLDVSSATFSSAGTVSPGVSPGILTVFGNYAQEADGALEIEIGGTNVLDFDLLTISGAAALDGALEVSLIGGFEPGVGDTFVVMAYSSQVGTFSDISSLELGGSVILIPEYASTELVLRAVQVPDIVYPVHPGVCISPEDPCPTVDFYVSRSNTDPVRAFSVTFTLSEELQLCDGLASIVEGPFLQNYCGGDCTAFQVNDEGDGTYTVDATILGGDCGPDSSGTLFSIGITHTGSDGTGTVAIDEVTIRDCNNAPLPGEYGQAIEIGINVTLPEALTDLSASQIMTGNDSDGTTGILVTFAGIEPGRTIAVYRKGFGDYPEYDDGTGEVPAIPLDPDDAEANGWTLTGLNGSGLIDEPGTRDYWYYVGFQYTNCGFVSPVSNMTDGTLNYHLGDVSDGLTQCEGDNDVGVADLSFLGDNYFKTGLDVDPVNCLDFGPTDDWTPSGLPTTDNAIDFEDLVIFGINFGEVGEPRLAPEPAVDEHPQLVLRTETDGQTVTTRLMLLGNRTIVKGLHSLIAYDPAEMTLIEVTEGSLLLRQPETVFSKHTDGTQGVVFDAAVIGRNATVSGSGEVAVLRFNLASPAADHVVALAHVDLRDLNNNFLLDPRVRQDVDEDDSFPYTPFATRLIGARPNPFAGNTAVFFQLAKETKVSIRVFDVTGHLLRTIGGGSMPAGEHRLSWDGTDDSGQRVPAGLYFYDFNAGGVKATRKVMRLVR